MSFNFYMNFVNRPPLKMEKQSYKSKVEKETYVPLAVQIKNFKDAGLRLDSIRRFKYDTEFLGHDDMLQVDPTRYPGFDPATAFQMAEELNQKLKEYRDKGKPEKVEPESNTEVVEGSDEEPELPIKSKKASPKATSQAAPEKSGSGG